MARRARAARRAGGRARHDARTRRRRATSRSIARCWPVCSATSDRRARKGRSTYGARGIRFAIFPGSALRKSQPKWVMAAELAETTRLYARCVARIAPEWIEPLAARLVQRHYFDPHWEQVARHGHGVRARDAVRAHDRAEAARPLRPDQSARSARDLHPQRARGGRARNARRLLRAQPAARARAARAREQGAPPRRAGGRARRSIASTTSVVPGRHLQRGRLRALAARGRGSEPAGALSHPRIPHAARGGRRSPKRSFPDTHAGRGGTTLGCAIASIRDIRSTASP